MTLAENVEVANLRAIAGSTTSEQHMGLAKLPCSWKNAEKGDIPFTSTRPSMARTGCATHKAEMPEGDPEIAKADQKQDFRHALSLGIEP